MALVQHNTPGTVQISGCTKVDVAYYEVEESSKMFMACSSCHEIVPGRDGEQVKDIGTNTFQEGYSIMGGEGGYRRARLGKL